MKIRLKGEIDTELLIIGCKPGDETEATPDPISKVGGMHFTITNNSRSYNCSVWPENYDVVTKN